jgi:hypothetical protein
MELKKYIENATKLIPHCVEHLQLLEYKDKELDFAYGLEEHHTSFKRLFKQIYRKIWR